MLDLSEGVFLDLNPKFKIYSDRGDFDPDEDWLSSSDGFGFDMDKALRYYATLYEKGGKALEIKDTLKRREYCLSESGVTDGKSIMPWVESMVEGEYLWFRNMINSVMVLQFDERFDDMMSLSVACDTLRAKVREEPEVNTMTSLMKFQTELRRVQEEMNGEPLEVSRLRDLKALMFQKSLGVKPEEYILNYEQYGKPFLHEGRV